MNIDEMEAGREMDKLVAELVMKKEPYRAEHKYFSGRFIHAEFLCNENEWINDEIRKGNYGQWEYCGPRFSSSIAAAWGVVKKMKEKTGFFQLTFEYHAINDTPHWYCGFDTVSSAEAETTPLAICRAALKAFAKEGSA